MKERKIIYFSARVAVFGALAIILYMVPGLQFPIIPGLSFLKLHFDEVPVLIAGLMYGPLTGSAIVILKGLFKLIQDLGETGGIGVLADILYGLALVLPASIIYKKHRTFKGGVIAILIGGLSSLIVSGILGYYIIYPLYGFYFNNSVTSYSEAMQYLTDILFNKADNSIIYWYDFKIIYEFLLPFNLIKLSIIILISLICYKPLSILDKRLVKDKDIK